MNIEIKIIDELINYISDTIENKYGTQGDWFHNHLGQISLSARRLDNELFTCACPYCDSEHFEQIQCELDDTRAYIVANCLDCGKKFDLTYACVKIDKIKED